MGELDVAACNWCSDFVKTLLILLAVMLGLGISAQAATPTSAVTLKRTQDVSHRHHHRYYHYGRYYSYRVVYYRHGRRYYRYY